MGRCELWIPAKGCQSGDPCGSSSVVAGRIGLGCGVCGLLDFTISSLLSPGGSAANGETLESKQDKQQIDTTNFLNAGRIKINY